VATPPIGLAGRRRSRSNIPRLKLALALLEASITARNRRHGICGVDLAARASLTTASRGG
jgi:hypothetical protein